MPSTVIAHIEYIRDTTTLRVRFISGMVYEYLNVPEETFNAMKQSMSKGDFLNRVIKKNFAYKKIGRVCQ
jgi:hypothetical protein